MVERSLARRKLPLHHSLFSEWFVSPCPLWRALEEFSAHQGQPWRLLGGEVDVAISSNAFNPRGKLGVEDEVAARDDDGFAS
jgi:hypothetical protein